MTDSRQIEYVPLTDLKADPRNPKAHDTETISASVGRFGLVDSIVLDGRTGQIISGHGRTKTLRAMHEAGESAPEGVQVSEDGQWLVPVLTGWSSRTDTEASAALIAMNRTTELGGWVDESLLELLDDLTAAGDDFAGVGYTPPDLEDLRDALDEAIDLDGLEEDEPDEVIPRHTRVSTGDVWLMGDHRLICGDSGDPAVIGRLLGGRKADLLWTDPPYGISYVGKTSEALTIDNDALDEDALEDFLRATLGLAHENLRPGGASFVCSPSGELFDVFAKVLREIGVRRHTLAWVKDQFVLGRADYHYRHESIFYGWNPGAAHIAPGDRTNDSVWEIDRPKRSSDHPTTKPVDLPARAIQNHTKRGDLILDVFAGSGGVVSAADQLGRIAAVVELSPQYCEVILTRWETLTGGKAALEESLI